MTIEQRLTKLERETRTWRLACVALALLAGLIASCSDQERHDAIAAANKAAGPEAIPEVIRATRIEAATIVLRNMLEQKETTLLPGAVLLEKEGKLRVALLSGPNGGEVQVYNTDGPQSWRGSAEDRQKQPVVAIKAGANAGGNVHVMNPAGKKVAILQSNNNDVGVLYTFDADGENPKAYGP